jgi:hypothetical protein
MYYKGTKAECEDYNANVTSQRNYDGVHSVKWAEIVAHPNGEEFAVRKHEDYTAELQEIEYLAEEWYTE